MFAVNGIAFPIQKPGNKAISPFDARRCFDHGFDFWAYGIQLQADRMGSLGLSNLKVAANFAYHHQITDGLYLSTGASGGLLHYRLDNDAMTFDSQFGIEGFDNSLSNLENFDTDNRSVFDLSAGLLLFDINKEWTAGFALHHVNQPTYSFFGEDKNRLGVGLSIHGSFTIGLRQGANKRNKLILRGLYRRQSTIENSRQWYSIAGATWKYQLKTNNKATALGLGLSGRISGYNIPDFLLFDALLPTVYLDYEDWSLGLSYDVNISSALKETHLRGGWEITVIWEFKRKKDGCVVCPKA